MKISAVFVIKSENGIDEYYMDMAIKSVLPYVSSIYVQDQCSTDNIVEIIKEIVGNKVPLAIEQVSAPFHRFSIKYNEPVYRNSAIERCEKIFDPEWIVQNDADDLFTPYFYETVREIYEKGDLEGRNSIIYATERFITPGHKSGWKGDFVEFGGNMYHDPHYKFWRASIKLRYPVVEEGHFHNVPETNVFPVYMMPPDKVCNIHLHRSFGPKAFNFWREGGDEFENTIPFNPRLQAPKKFTGPQNMGSAVEVDFEWPEYIISKWDEWGDLTENRRNYK